ncbi:MAG: transposase [Polyangiales bacterium]
MGRVCITARSAYVRYCARPPFALDRIERLANGDIAYRVKYARRGATHRVMTPIEFLARLAALIPPPRYPLVRYHGVLAPHAKWRSEIVPRRADDPRPHRHGEARRHPRSTSPDAPLNVAPAASISMSIVPVVAAPAPSASEVARFGPASSALQPAPAAPPANILRAAHLHRLDGGALLAKSPRVDWPTLMRRTFDFDVLHCPKCDGRMRVVADIQDPLVIADILAHLRKPTRAPPLARARAPDEHDDDAPPSSP